MNTYYVYCPKWGERKSTALAILAESEEEAAEKYVKIFDEPEDGYIDIGSTSIKLKVSKDEKEWNNIIVERSVVILHKAVRRK